MVNEELTIYSADCIYYALTGGFVFEVAESQSAVSDNKVIKGISLRSGSGLVALRYQPLDMDILEDCGEPAAGLTQICHTAFDRNVLNGSR